MPVWLPRAALISIYWDLARPVRLPLPIIHEFLFASSGLDALAILSDRTDIDLVITDLNMPDMDGLELLAAMEDSFPGLPSMVVSAYGDPDRMARASERGAGAFVVKPVDFPAFRELLSSSFALSGS